MRKTKAYYGGFNIIIDTENIEVKKPSQLKKDDTNKTITITIECYLNMFSQGVLSRYDGSYIAHKDIKDTVDKLFK